MSEIRCPRLPVFHVFGITWDKFGSPVQDDFKTACGLMVDEAAGVGAIPVSMAASEFFFKPGLGAFACCIGCARSVAKV